MFLSVCSRICYNIMRALVVVVACHLVWLFFTQGGDLGSAAEYTIFFVYFVLLSLVDILIFLNKDNSQ